MVRNAIFNERKDGKTFDCEEVSRVLSMDIPVALILEMPSIRSDWGSSHILIYFPQSSNAIIYDTMKKLNKFSIKKIADINYYNEPRDPIKEYQYVISLAPFLKPQRSGIYRYIIDFSICGSKYLEIVVYYKEDDRNDEKLEIWHYNDMAHRCKNPEKLGTWLPNRSIDQNENILVWEIKEGIEIEKGMHIPHICGYHERPENEYD